MRVLQSLIIVFLVASSLSAQWTLKGNIQDTNSEKGLRDVTVTCHHNDETTTATTSKRGSFKIKIQDSTDVVTFAKEGYYPETLIIRNAKKVRVGLTKMRNTRPDEVMTDSYGSQNMKEVTSAVTILKTQDFNKAVAIDIYELLRGKVPGLIVRRDSQSPNSEPSVMLRSAASTTNVIEPLIIVDGNSNFSLRNVDPNDVETVQVLRDGSAAAMYGSQAVGGVIIITTKSK